MWPNGEGDDARRVKVMLSKQQQTQMIQKINIHYEERIQFDDT